MEERMDGWMEDSYEVMTGSDAEKRWGEDWEITSGQT